MSASRVWSEQYNNRQFPRYPVSFWIFAGSRLTTIEFVCIVHRNVAPMLHFERDDIRWLGVMGAKLDVDIFIINDAKSQNKYASPAAPSAGAGGATGEKPPPATGSNPSF